MWQLGESTPSNGSLTSADGFKFLSNFRIAVLNRCPSSPTSAASFFVKFGQWLESRRCSRLSLVNNGEDFGSTLSISFLVINLLFMDFYLLVFLSVFSYICWSFWVCTGWYVTKCPAPPHSLCLFFNHPPILDLFEYLSFWFFLIFLIFSITYMIAPRSSMWHSLSPNFPNLGERELLYTSVPLFYPTWKPWNIHVIRRLLLSTDVEQSLALTTPH